MTCLIFVHLVPIVGVLQHNEIISNTSLASPCPLGARLYFQAVITLAPQGVAVPGICEDGVVSEL